MLPFKEMNLIHLIINGHMWVLCPTSFNGGEHSDTIKSQPQKSFLTRTKQAPINSRRYGSHSVSSSVKYFNKIKVNDANKPVRIFISRVYCAVAYILYYRGWWVASVSFITASHKQQKENKEAMLSSRINKGWSFSWAKYNEHKSVLPTCKNDVTFTVEAC